MGDGHPESPERLRAIEKQLIDSGLMQNLQRHEAPLATTEQLARVSIPSGSLRASVKAGNAKPGDQVTLGIRPEHCQLKLQENMDCLQGEVLLVEHLGDETLTYLEVEGAEENVIVREEGEYADVKVGDRISVGVPQQHCHLFDGNGAAFTRVQEEEAA